MDYRILVGAAGVLFIGLKYILNKNKQIHDQIELAEEARILKLTEELI